MKVNRIIVVAVVLSLVTGSYVLAGGKQEGPEMIRFRLLTTETDPNSIEAIKSIIADYQEINPFVDIEPEFLSWNDMYPRITAALAANNPPEIVGLEDIIAARFVQEDLLLPMTDVVDDLNRDDFLDTALDAMKAGSTSGNEFMVAYALGDEVEYFRADIYKDLGLTPVETWDEFEENVRKTTIDLNGDKQIDIYGGNIPLGNSRYTGVVFWATIKANGASIFDKNDYIVMDKSPNLERTAQALNHWKNLAQYGPPGMAEYTWFETMQSYYSGKTAHAIFGGRLMTQIDRYAPELATPDKTQAMLVPHGPNGDFSSALCTDGWCVMKGTRNPEAAKEFIKFMLGRDHLIRILHTVPGHMWPAQKSILESAEFEDHPLIRKNHQVFEKNKELVRDHAEVPYLENGGVHFRATEVFDSPIINTMVQSVILNNEDPVQAVRTAAEKFRELGIGK